MTTSAGATSAVAPAMSRPFGGDMATCEVESCERDTIARGLCKRHYERNRLHGQTAPLRYQDPMFGTPLKTCRVCGEVKLRDQFSSGRDTADGLRNECRPCRSQQARDKYAASIETRQRTAARGRKNLYGLDQAAFDTLLERQGGGCGLCGGQPTVKGWVVDHCHGSNKVRGVLCHPCNLGLGMFGDSVERLTQALTYLKRTQEGC